MREMALRSARARACAPVSLHSLGTHWVFYVYVPNKMGRSRFPGKPLKFQNRKRISVLSGTVYHETAPESQPPVRGPTTNDFAGEQEVFSFFGLLFSSFVDYITFEALKWKCFIYVMTRTTYEVGFVSILSCTLWHFIIHFHVNKIFVRTQTMECSSVQSISNLLVLWVPIFITLYLWLCLL